MTVLTLGTWWCQVPKIVNTKRAPIKSQAVESDMENVTKSDVSVWLIQLFLFFFVFNKRCTWRSIMAIQNQHSSLKWCNDCTRPGCQRCLQHNQHQAQQHEGWLGEMKCQSRINSTECNWEFVFYRNPCAASSQLQQGIGWWCTWAQWDHQIS